MAGCTEMLGRKDRDQLELFVTGSLEQLVPEDHVLARVDRVLDLSWLHEELADCYCPDNGRPGIDPEVAVRLMLAGLLLGIVHDRRLLREAQVNLAIRWFIGHSLHERLPDHSSLTRIRQRWGETRFREIFKRTVTACLEAKIATAEVVHIDASLIRANVSWDSLAERHVGTVAAANAGDPETGAKKPRARRRGAPRKVSRTDPDASMATSACNRRHEPSYKQHTAVDDVRGVVLDVAVTTGAVSERQVLVPQIDAVRETTGCAIGTVTADAGYAFAKVFDGLETNSVLRLLKLHGSINWRPKLGYASPVAIDSITHHHDWAGISLLHPQVGGHLEPEPVMVPPVLSKSSLVEQPVLRLVWSQAFDRLATAHEVTFIGYSFPATDMAARTLFSEALKDLPRDDINVVNLSREDSEIEAIRRRYHSVLGGIPDERFHFDDALEWTKGLSR